MGSGVALARGEVSWCRPGWCVLLTCNRVGWTGSVVTDDWLVAVAGTRRAETPEEAYRQAAAAHFHKMGTLPAWISPRSARRYQYAGPAGPVGLLGADGQWAGWR